MLTKTVTIRPWQPEDVTLLATYANNPHIASNLTDGFPHPYSREDAHEFIMNAIQQNPVQCFAIIADGEVAGSIGVFPQQDIHRRNAEIGYFLAEPFWGKGITTKAVQLITLRNCETRFRTFV